jgi:hypothetical protein
LYLVDRGRSERTEHLADGLGGLRFPTPRSVQFARGLQPLSLHQARGGKVGAMAQPQARPLPLLGSGDGHGAYATDEHVASHLERGARSRAQHCNSNPTSAEQAS